MIFIAICLSSADIKGQCLDTNTLLDSIYTLQKSNLNNRELLIDRRRRELYSPGDKYQMIIVDKILQGIRKDSTLYGADSSRYHNHSPSDNFLIHVKNDSLQGYKLALMKDIFNFYLLTLGPSLKLIDFISIIESYPSTYSSTEKTEYNSGIRTSYEGNIFTQFYYSRTTNLKNQKSVEVIKSTKRFKINSLERFIELK
ncbi:MAG: hypothetical protein K2Q22_17395 [Cytophagales bacterium]|nr:hypothetical protein [Cytophagales bacterium]